MPKADLNYKLLESILAELNHLWIHPNRLVSVACRPITGGYGTVTVAKLHGVMDPATGSDFLVASLARELKVWQSLEHPNILYLFGFYLSEDKTEARLISPFIELGHIKGFIHDKNPDLAKCVDLALDVASGLDYLHTLKPPICHGDIKTGNILVNEELRAVICDFGVAKALDDPESPSGLTTTDTFKGSVRYNSYELVMEDPPRKSLKSDIWAYGCVLLEASSIETIFFQKVPYAWCINPSLVYITISKGVPPAKVETLDPLPFESLRWILGQCWQLNPELRPSARDIILPLNQASGQLRSAWSSADTTPRLGGSSSLPSSESISLPASPDPQPGAIRGVLTFTQFDALQQPRECQIHTLVRCSISNLHINVAWPTVLNIRPADYKLIPEDGVSSLFPSGTRPVFAVEVDSQFDLLDPYDHTKDTGPIHFQDLWETLARNNIYAVASPTTKKKWLEAVFVQPSSKTDPPTPEDRRSLVSSPRRRGDSWSL
ncbi:hypothetical protein FRC05_009759 [Tulasnella sp. 425]|nr:hypothetical protein FRC05_009759 [Tulasnella sp. 425]